MTGGFFKCLLKSLPLFCLFLIPVLLLLVMHFTTGCSILWFLGTLITWLIAVFARALAQFHRQ